MLTSALLCSTTHAGAGNKALLDSTVTAANTVDSWIDEWSQTVWMLKQNNGSHVQLLSKETITDEKESGLIYRLKLDVHDFPSGSPVVLDIDASLCNIDEDGAGECPFNFEEEGSPLLDVYNLKTSDEEENTLVFDPKRGKETAELKFIVSVMKNGETFFRHIFFEYGGHQYIRTKPTQTLFKQLTRWYGEIDSSPHWRYWYMDWTWNSNTYIWLYDTDVTQPKGNMVQLHIRTWGPSYAPELDILIDDCELTDDDLLGSCTFNITSEVNDFYDFINSNHGRFLAYRDDHQTERPLYREDWQKIKDNKSFKHTIELSHHGVRGDDKKTPHRFLTLTFDDGEGGTARFVVSNSDKDEV